MRPCRLLCARVPLGDGLLRADGLPLRGFSSAAPDAYDFAIRDLNFVDRREEVFELAFVNINNQKLNVSHKDLPVADQVFGAGKTELGIHAVARAGLQRDRLVELFPGNTAMVDDYLRAVTVMIRLDDHRPAAEVSVDKYIAGALCKAITSAASDNSNRKLEWATNVLEATWSVKALPSPMAGWWRRSRSALAGASSCTSMRHTALQCCLSVILTASRWADEPVPAGPRERHAPAGAASGLCSLLGRALATARCKGRVFVPHGQGRRLPPHPHGSTEAM